jgi:thymidylate kinase
MSKFFICFTGTDGSGKSTLVTNVVEDLQKREKKLKKTYGRYLPFLMKYAMALGRSLFFSKYDMYSDYDKYLDNKRFLFKKVSMVSRFYMYLTIVEYYFEIVFKIIIPLKMGFSVISDRYVYDTIINDICIDMGLSISDANDLLKKFWYFFPKPDITFLVKVPEDVAIKRKEDIPSLSYLKVRNEFYNKMSISEHFIVLDGTLDVLELQRKVISNFSIIIREEKEKK